MKKGLDFFAFNVNFFDDDKIGLTEAEHEHIGGYIAVRLMCKIYDVEGYYCEWGEDAMLLFAKKIGVGSKTLRAVVETLVKREFFNKDMYEKYQILTSRAFQRQYAAGSSRRHSVNIKAEYLLIPRNELPKYGNLRIDGEAAAQQKPSNAGLPERPGQASPAPAPQPTAAPAEVPGATITRKRSRPASRKLNDELRILSEFFWRNFVSPEKQLDKFIRHNELTHQNTGGWAKMNSNLRLVACVEWKQLDDNKKPITNVRFQTEEQKAFLDAWKTLFNMLAYQYDAPEDILTGMVRDCVKWVHVQDYYKKGNIETGYQLGCPKEVVDYLNANQSVVEPVLRPLIKNESLKYVAV